MTGQADLFEHLDALSASVSSPTPLPMEKLGQSYGFIVYTIWISGPRPIEQLHLQEVRDRALIYLNGQFIGVIERSAAEQTVFFEVPFGGAELRIVVENMGRINYGPYLKDRKGITEGVRLGFQFLFDWQIHMLPMEDLSPLVFDALSVQKHPAFYKAELYVDQKEDTFIHMGGWTKGVVFLNGFNLGRYWEKGPQQTLYVPAPLLRQGNNDIVVFELHGTDETTITFTDTPVLNS